MPQIKITLKKIIAHNPCEDGLERLLKAKPNLQEDEEFNLSECLETNSLDDVLWTLTCLTEHDNLWRKFAVWCARQVQHLMLDERSIKALDVAWAFSEGNASSEELEAAGITAHAAARDIRAYQDARNYHAAWIARNTCYPWPVQFDAWTATWSSLWAIRATNSVKAVQKQKFKEILEAGHWVD